MPGATPGDGHAQGPPGALAQMTVIRSALSIEHVPRCRKEQPGIPRPCSPRGPADPPVTPRTGGYPPPRTPGRSARPAALKFEQPDGGQLIGDQDIEEPSVQRAQDRLGLVF